jgi:hypothetical protein
VDLPGCGLHLVDPDRVVLLVVIAVELDSSIQLRGVCRLSIEGTIDVTLSAVEGDRDQRRLVAVALKLQHQMVPAVCGRSRTPDTGIDPASVRSVPDIPLMRSPDYRTACRNELAVVDRLVHIELEGLGRTGVLYVKVQIIDKMGSRGNWRQLSTRERYGKVSRRQASIE